jgi:SET domain-containing protein
MQYYAIRDIKAGDQLFYSYCLAGGSQAERQAELLSYGFVCKCAACVDATPETDELRKTFSPDLGF